MAGSIGSSRGAAIIAVRGEKARRVDLGFVRPREARKGRAIDHGKAGDNVFSSAVGELCARRAKGANCASDCV
jgi:hypothetical protein